MKKAAALLIANTVSALTIASITGITLSRAIQGIFPAGLGPITTVPVDAVKLSLEKKEREEEDKSTITEDYKLKRLIRGNILPGGTQYNKTIGVMDILNKGYDETPKGNIRYVSPDSILEKIKGLILGKGSLDVNKEFYKKKRQPLGEIQSKILKSSKNKEAYYNYIMNSREKKGSVKIGKIILHP